MRLLGLLLGVIVLAHAAQLTTSGDETAGASSTADNAAPQQVTPEGEADPGSEKKTSQQGAGRLVRPGMEEDVAEKKSVSGANTTLSAQEEEEKKKMVCLCKKSSKVPAEQDDKVLAAGWRKRAKKCEASAEENAQGEDKCVVVKKAARCETKEDRKKNEQCGKPKTKKQKEAEIAARQTTKEAKQGEEAAEKKSQASKCLSKYCADADNLNRAKTDGKPPSGTQCYDRCNKSHCTKLFDSGWEHWYECVQTCVANCFAFED